MVLCIQCHVELEILLYNWVTIVISVILPFCQRYRQSEGYLIKLECWTLTFGKRTLVSIDLPASIAD